MPEHRKPSDRSQYAIKQAVRKARSAVAELRQALERAELALSLLEADQPLSPSDFDVAARSAYANAALAEVAATRATIGLVDPAFH